MNNSPKPALPASEEAKQIVLKYHKDAFQSYSGRVWTSEADVIAADDVPGTHSTKTKYFLGEDWIDAASRLPALSEDQLDALLKNTKPATKEELREQGENLANNYRPGPRQAVPFKPVLEDGPAEGIATRRTCTHCDFGSGRRGMDRCAKCDGNGWVPVEPAASAEKIVTKGTACVCGTAKSYHYHPSDNPSALRDGKCSGYKSRYPVESAAPVVAAEVEYPICAICKSSTVWNGHFYQRKYPSESHCDNCDHSAFEKSPSQPTPVVVQFELPDAEILRKHARIEESLNISLDQAARTWAANEWNKRAYEFGRAGASDFEMAYRTALSLAEDLYRTLRTAQPAPLPSGDKNTFEEVLINRAGEYRDMEREHRRYEEHEAACTCSDKASGIHVALKLFRLWNASKEPPALPVGQNETFEEWRRSPEACAIFAEYAPGFAAPMIKAARAAWNAVKGQKDMK